MTYGVTFNIINPLLQWFRDQRKLGPRREIIDTVVERLHEFLSVHQHVLQHDLTAVAGSKRMPFLQERVGFSVRVSVSVSVKGLCYVQPV